MLIIQEQTAFYQLDKEKQKNTAIKFANACISNQIMGPLQTIIQYVEILLRKLEQRPDICNLLDAIKYLNNSIMFQIQDLQDISNITKNRFKVKFESFNVHEAIKETIKINKM